MNRSNSATQYFKTKTLKASHAITQMCSVSRSPNLPQLVSVLCVGALLFNTYRLYKGGYLGLDDFNNLYWVQHTSFQHMVRYILNPVSRAPRLTGMMCYSILFRFFDLNPAAYHCLTWSLHAANTAFVYFILKRLTGSRAGAAVGAMLFASQAVFAAIYWDFGTIFELVAAFFSLLGIFLWTSERRGWLRVLFASLALLLAIEGKEMALTMPILWLSYDLLLRKNMVRRMAAHWILPSALALWYVLFKATAMTGRIPSDPYYMSISASTLARSFGIYFNMLFGTSFQWDIWCVGFVILLLVFALLRNRLALFFQVYVFIAFLPVIFLINHRFAFYWYLPFLGVSGLVAMLAKSVAVPIETRNPHWLVECGASVVFILLCWGTFLVHEKANRPQRSWERALTGEYRAFVTGLRALPAPPPGETIFFDSQPSLFDEAVLQTATQVALGRTDVHTKLVAEFPPEARYRLRFQESRLVQLPR
jgi:hypothetical protein